MARAAVRRPTSCLTTALRVGTVTLAVLASSGLAVSPASAAGAATVTLQPTSIDLTPRQVETFGALQVAAPTPAVGGQVTPAAFGGTVTLAVPPQFVAGPVSAVLSLGDQPTMGASKDVVRYDSASTDPATRLALTDLGAGRYRIGLPADDHVHGPYAQLELGGFGLPSPVPGVQPRVEDASWTLQLSEGGPAPVQLAREVAAVAVTCGAQGSDTCTPLATVHAGGPLTVTLPTGSAFRALGVPDLRSSVVALQPIPAGAASLPPATRPVPATRRQVSAGTVELTLPRTTAPGRYWFQAVMGDGSGQLWADEQGVVDVVAPNPGLASATGWDEHTSAPAGLSPMVPAGAGLVLVAGVLGATVAVRSRRRAGADA